MCKTLYNALLNYKKKQQYLKKMYGNQYMSYHFEDVKNKYGKIVEKRIVQNESNILQINNANMVFVREDGKYVGRNILNYPIGNEDTLVVHHHCQSDASSQFLLFCKSINTD